MKKIQTKDYLNLIKQETGILSDIKADYCNTTKIKYASHDLVEEVFGYRYNVPDNHKYVFGFELEYETRYRTAFVKAFDSIVDVPFCFKEDASLSDYQGVEINTAPFSFNEALQFSKWFDNLDVKEHIYTPNSDTGMHVHVNLGLFVSGLHESKFVLFYNYAPLFKGGLDLEYLGRPLSSYSYPLIRMHNCYEYKKCKKVAGCSSVIDFTTKYAYKLDAKTVENRTLVTGSTARKSSHGTVEVRAFKTPITREQFIKKYYFLLVSIIFSKEVGLSHFNQNTLLRYLDNYQYLYKEMLGS